MKGVISLFLALLVTACVPAKPVTETNFIAITLCNEKLEGVIVINSDGNYKAISTKDLSPEIYTKLHDTAPEGHTMQLDIQENTLCGGS